MLTERQKAEKWLEDSSKYPGYWDIKKVYAIIGVTYTDGTEVSVPCTGFSAWSGEKVNTQEFLSEESVQAGYISKVAGVTLDAPRYVRSRYLLLHFISCGGIESLTILSY